MALKRAFKARRDTKPVEEIMNPRLSRYMAEDVKKGVLFVSLRDVACEFD